MKINISSFGCSLAFEPYLAISLAEFLTDTATSRVVRQGGQGLIIRSDGELVLRHQQRQSSLGRNEARHYSATIQLRRELYDISRTQDEIVLANLGDELLLSHPQSEMWLSRESVAALVDGFVGDTRRSPEALASALPEWLSVSSGAGNILLSDQRSGRWVLLGEDHIRELERRLDFLGKTVATAAAPVLPTLQVKGMVVHLASAFKLAAALFDFENSGDFAPYEEITPAYWLKASRSNQGIELSDSNTRVGLTAREARKWLGIIRSELDRLGARSVERGGIRTVFANSEDGKWVLQWGDQVHIPGSVLSRLSESPVVDSGTGCPGAQLGEFLVLLDPASGGCVALTEQELGCLIDRAQTAIDGITGLSR
jgi:hypothetical protein